MLMGSGPNTEEVQVSSSGGGYIELIKEDAPAANSLSLFSPLKVRGMQLGK